MFRCQTKQQRMFQGVTSEKSNRYWDYRNGGVCEKYIFHTTRNGGYHEKKEFYAELLIGARSVWQSVLQSQFFLHSYTVTEIIIRSSRHWWSSDGNEINAVVAQMVASLLYGAVWAGASVIWEMDDWSLLRQDSDSSAGRFDCNISGCISDVLDET